MSPQGYLAATVHHVGDLDQVSHHLTVECVGVVLPRFKSLSHPRVSNRSDRVVLLTVAHPPVDTFCLGTCKQGRRPVCASSTGMQLYLDVIRWCRSRKPKAQSGFGEIHGRSANLDAPVEPQPDSLDSCRRQYVAHTFICYLLRFFFSFHIHHLLAHRLTAVRSFVSYLIFPSPFFFGLNLHLASILNVDCPPIVPIFTKAHEIMNRE